MFPFTHSRDCHSWQHIALFAGAAALLLSLTTQTRAQETIGGGTVASPAVGPAPSFLPPDIPASNMVLVKNWHFGTDGTITDYADLNANFQYHDQHNSIANGPNAYGALIVAPDDANAIFPGDVYYYDDDGSHQGRGLGTGQPIEGRDSAPVRQFTTDSIKTFLTPLSHANTYVNGVLTVLPDRHEVGCGSFMPKWFLPAGGSLLGQDIVWETKVRYVTPPYFWFSLWTDGNAWNNGAEHDLIETYGEDYLSEGAGTGYGNNNFDGHLWHSNSVAGADTVNYFTGGWWGQAMAQQGINSYDATQYHLWTWVYKHDNSYAMYVDGIKVQSGTGYNWTVGTGPSNYPINMDFRFDATWGHLSVKQVDKPLAASVLAGAYYEFNYSHVYLSQPYPYSPPTVSLPGTVQAVNYENGGAGVAYNQGPSGNITLYRPDNSGADYGTALGWTAPGQWYKYAVNVAAAGVYNLSFQAGSNNGGTFHVEDETGRNLTGPVTAPSSGGDNNFQLTTASQPVTLAAGPHTLKWVQDTGGYDLYSMTVSPGDAPYNGPHNLPGTVNATDYDTGGAGFAYNQLASSGGTVTGYRPDNSGADYGPAIGFTATGQWYKYTVNVGAGGPFTVSFRAGSPNGGTFHLEDETGRNLTGSVSAPVTGGYQTPGTVTVPTPVTLTPGVHTLKWVQETGGYDLDSVTFTATAPVLITGPVFSDGAGPWHSVAANAAPAVFDGKTNTFYDCANASTGYVGIDAGTAQTVTKITYAPRAGYEKRMVGGVFEGSSTSATAGYTTLATVTATPKDGLVSSLTVTSTAAYRWLRYRGPAGSYCNVAEIQFLH